MAEIKEIVRGEIKDYVPRSRVAQQLLEDAGTIAQVSPDDLAAYVIVAVDRRGIPSICAQDDPDGPISLRMLAGLAQSCITESLIVEPAIRQVLINSGLAAPDPSAG